MEDETHRCMIGDYEVIQAIHIGDREIVSEEKIRDESVEKCICAFCQQNELSVTHSEVMYSNNYVEIVEMLGECVTEQAERTRVTVDKPRVQSVDDRLITASDCIIASYENGSNNKIVIIKSGVLRREYRRATCQLELCTGGFSAYPCSRGSVCLCIDFYTRGESRCGRMNILDIMEPEKLPGRAKHGLLTVQQERAGKEQRKGEKEAR